MPSNRSVIHQQLTDAADMTEFPERDPGGFPIDWSRPIVRNKDGSYSTERTITAEMRGSNYIIPTMHNGVQVPPRVAVDLAHQDMVENGTEYPHYDDPDEAEKQAWERHYMLQRVYGDDADSADRVRSKYLMLKGQR